MKKPYSDYYTIKNYSILELSKHYDEVDKGNFCEATQIMMQLDGKKLQTSSDVYRFSEKPWTRFGHSNQLFYYNPDTEWRLLPECVRKRINYIVSRRDNQKLGERQQWEQEMRDYTDSPVGRYFEELRQHNQSILAASRRDQENRDWERDHPEGD